MDDPARSREIEAPSEPLPAKVEPLSPEPSTATSAILSLDEAVGRLPREVVELFEDRLRGQFREVRPYQPTALGEEASASASGTEEPVDPVEAALGEDEEE